MQTKSVLPIVIAVVVGLLALIAIPVISYISAYNTGNALEQQLKAAKENNENILAQYGQKIQEAAQIPSMQRDDLLAVFTGAIEARYGAEGSQAAFQWLQEQNPNLDQQTYVQLQRMIEAGRNDFTVGQTKMIDIKRGYETKLGSFWGGTWLKIAGYPKIDLADYKIVSTGRAKDAFEKGVEDSPIKLR